jgi:Phosphoesterase family
MARLVGTRGAVEAAEVSADALGQLVSGQRPRRLDNRTLTVNPHGLDGIEPGNLYRQVADDDADPWPCCLTCWLWVRIHARTARLTCQEALSQISTQTGTPYAKQGFVDHTQYDTTSILKLIETRWHLKPLGTRDAAANDLTNALDLSQLNQPDTGDIARTTMIGLVIAAGLAVLLTGGYSTYRRRFGRSEQSQT